MKNFTVPDICDEFEEIQIGDLFLNSFGGAKKLQEPEKIGPPH